MQTLNHAPKKHEAIFLIKHASLNVKLVLTALLTITLTGFLSTFLSFYGNEALEQTFKFLSVSLLSLIITLIIYYASIAKILIETIISDVSLMNDIIDDYNYLVSLYKDLEMKYISVRDERNDFEEKLESATKTFKMTIDECHKVIDGKDILIKSYNDNETNYIKEIKRLEFENNSFRKELELTTPRKEN